MNTKDIAAYRSRRASRLAKKAKYAKNDNTAKKLLRLSERQQSSAQSLYLAS